MNLTAYINHHAERINRTLEELIPEKEVAYNSLFQAARYSLIGPGKRIRPILTLAAVDALGGNINHALKPACAIELIHTYSLIHDDLPCMDNDDFRRGKPSLHKIYPEGHALLTGDFLLTYAFDVLAHAPHLNPEQGLTLVAILARYAGGDGMVGGQAIDLQAAKSPISYEVMKTMHKLKTGGLITASLEFGAVIAKAPMQHREILREFGQDIGLAFQIVDDILDYTEGQKKDGKISSDYVSLLGLEKAKEAAHDALHYAEKKLNSLPYETGILRDLAHFIVHRNH